VLNNECTAAQKNAVLANSSFAIQCFEPTKSLAECTNIAQESIESGKALKCLKGIMS
jgi:anthranilate phosphoribosyltransferase